MYHRPLHSSSAHVKAKKKTPPAAAADEQRELVPIRIAGVPEHFNLPWMLGLERRAFVRAGIELHWSTVPEGTGAMSQMLDEGAIDVALMVTEGAVRYLLNSGKGKILAGYVDSSLTWGVHVGATTEVNEAAQLKGARFAISRPNSGSHLAALAYAREKDLPLAENELLTVNDLPGAETMMAGADPVAFLWERYTTKPLVDRGVFRLVDEFRNTWPAFVIVASEAIVQEQGPALGRMLKVVRDQAKGLMSKRTAPEMVAHRYGLQLEDAKAWFAQTQWNTGAPLEDGMLRHVAEELIATGMSVSQEELESRLATMVVR